jgi:thiamine pyrophosphokinase
MKKCIIIGAGDFTAPRGIDEGDLVIAADGGFDRLMEAGIRPHLFMGDMDSLRSPLPSDLEKITFPERKDYTDMHLAYLEGRERGYREFEIYGGTGGRGDHTFANISLLLKIAEDGNLGRMVTEGEIYTVIKNGAISLEGEKNSYISVFAIGGVADGVTLTGLDYEVENASLTPDFPLGVSNRFTEKRAEISVKNGSLLIIYQTALSVT